MTHAVTVGSGSSKKLAGLILRNGLWHIDKMIFGKRICESTHTADLGEAESVLAHRICEARKFHLFGETRDYGIREAAEKYFADFAHKPTIARDRQAWKVLEPFIGHLLLKHVHNDTIQPYVRFRQDKGRSPGTINRDLAIVRRILNLAARCWRNEAGRPWLPVAPVIPKFLDHNARHPYPLSVAEERLLFSELDEHLRIMAEFKVNTGLREKEVVTLRWEWEVDIPELGTSIFVIPREHTKKGMDRHVVLNGVARDLIQACRGKHQEFVFSLNGKPIGKMYNSGWKAARRRASLRYEAEIGRACPKGFKSIRVHDMKHTWGHRLRAVGVGWEDRKVLLGHKARDWTTHYSAAEIGTLITAAEKVCALVSSGSETVSVVRKADPFRATGKMLSQSVQQAKEQKPSGDPDLLFLPRSLANAAADYADADGVSLEQFIATAVAEKIGSLRAQDHKSRQPGAVPWSRQTEESSAAALGLRNQGVVFRMCQKMQHRNAQEAAASNL